MVCLINYKYYTNEVYFIHNCIHVTYTILTFTVVNHSEQTNSSILSPHFHIPGVVKAFNLRNLIQVIVPKSGFSNSSFVLNSKVVLAKLVQLPK